MIDLEAIRKRNKERFTDCYDCGHSHDGTPAREDVRTLLAEVEQIRLAVRDAAASTVAVCGTVAPPARVCLADVITKYVADPLIREVERLRELVHDEVCHYGYDQCGGDPVAP